MEDIVEQLRTNICSILTSISEETVDDIIQAVKDFGLESLSDLQFVREKDFKLLLKPIPRRKLVNAWREPNFFPPCNVNSNIPDLPPLAQEQGQTYDNLISNTCPGISDLSASSSSLERLRGNEQFCGPLPSEPHLEVSGLTSTGSRRVETVSDDNAKKSNFASLKKNRLGNQLGNKRKRKVDNSTKVLNSTKLSFTAPPSVSGNQHEQTKTGSPDSDEIMKLPTPQRPQPPEIIISDDEENAYDRCQAEFSSLSSSNVSSNIPDMPMFSHGRASTTSGHMNTSEPLSKKFCSSDNHAVNSYQASLPPGVSSPTDGSFPPESSSVTPSLTSTNVKCIPSVKLKNVQLHWKGKCFALLQIYSKYKTILSCPDAEENRKVWKKIADEVQQKCSLNCDESQCKDQIDNLRHQYKGIKRKKQLKGNAVLSNGEITFFKQANKAFEITNKSVVPSSASDPSSLKSQKSIPESSLKIIWGWKKCFSLLRTYKKYKTELDAAKLNERFDVWTKIAKEIQGRDSFNCDGMQCCYKVKKLRKKYGRIKKRTPVNKNECMFMEKARKLFEDAENSGKHKQKSDHKQRMYHKRRIANKKLCKEICRNLV